MSQHTLEEVTVSADKEAEEDVSDGVSIGCEVDGSGVAVCLIPFRIRHIHHRLVNRRKEDYECA